MNAFLHAVPEAYRAWAWAFALFAAATLTALLAHILIYSVGRRMVRRTTGVAGTSFVVHTRRPARFLLVLIAFRIVAPATGLSGPTLDIIGHAVAIGLFASVTWMIIRATSVIHDVIMSRYQVDVDDNLLARRMHTQMRLLIRAAMIIAAIIGFCAVLMTFEAVRGFGASLLASAGVAGLVVGLAARPAIANFIAGIQLALTQPIRLDDVVIVEGEWGRIEEITATYVVVAIWDQRRLVVPLQYFIDHPFQNWTRRTAEIIGTVFIHADYTVPVQAVREQLRQIATSSGKWDGRVCVLQVTGATDRTVELRALVSAADSSSAWDLRCEVREKLIEFLQRTYPDCLPRLRADVAGEETGARKAAAISEGRIATPSTGS